MEQRNLGKSDVERIFNQWLNAPELRSEVRGYLRHRLYTALHNSKLGPNFNQLDVHPVSPKLQTLNLLIAEYLLKSRHHFTLSVFSCEAPNVSCISPNIPEMLKVQSADGSSSHVFSKEDFEDIVETLGLPKNSNVIQQLQQKYQEARDQALITCIIRSMPDFLGQNQMNTGLQSTAEVQGAELNREIEILKRQCQEEVKELTEYFQRELQRKDLIIKELQRAAADSDAAEQNDRIETLQSQLKEMEKQFKNFEAAKEREIVGLKKLNMALENEMLDLQGALEARKKHLRDEEFRMEREKLTLKRNKKKLQKHQKQLDEVSIALTENFPDQSMLPALEIQVQMKDQEIAELRSKYLSLVEENKMLKNLSTQQRSRIESLDRKVASLVDELHLARERALRARQIESEGESSPTDDVVKDARKRIRSLEEEFEAIEKQHRDYKNRSDVSPFFSTSLGNDHIPTSPRTKGGIPQQRLQPAAATRSPGSAMLEEIQTSIKSLYDSVQAKPERLSQARNNSGRSRAQVLDVSMSSISSESTGIEGRERGLQLPGPSGIKSVFSQRLDESISPILPEDNDKQENFERRNPPLNQTTQLADSLLMPQASKSLDATKTNIPTLEAEPLGTSDELKLTIPSSSSSSSSSKVNAADMLKTTVTEKVVTLGDKNVSTVGRSDGDGMVVTSTSEDHSAPAISAARDDDDNNFWDL
ncbi:protein hook homolog isoform X2 [Neocloeon triangulifer]|uniref:protein hook homolog isoform X2 n=1 Tax=Neocloeon triangulifer TaxID=2078957 RepID=UPI00286F9082|nr:protein hook homolog isoform X2 [Neocloeon triangulifer]